MISTYVCIHTVLEFWSSADSVSFISQCIPFYDKSLEAICHQKCCSYVKKHMAKQKPFRKNSCALHFNYPSQQTTWF